MCVLLGTYLFACALLSGCVACLLVVLCGFVLLCLVWVHFVFTAVVLVLRRVGIGYGGIGSVYMYTYI